MPQDISLDTVIAAQTALAEKKAKSDQYAKELISAQKRADRLKLEVAEAQKSFDEIRKAYESNAKTPNVKPAK